MPALITLSATRRRIGRSYTALAANKDTPSQWTRQSLQNVVKLYETWDRAEPNAGHAEKAAQWRARIR